MALAGLAGAHAQNGQPPAATQEAKQERTDQSLPPFPKPNPAAAFPEMKIYDKDGRFYRTPREDWKGAAARSASDPDWKSWVEASRAALDEWIETRQDHVEWEAGWRHSFISPRDGSFLTFTPDEPGEETLYSPSDPKVRLTPALHAAWVTIFRQTNMEQMLEAARFYRLTGERKYLDWVLRQLDFYALHCKEFRPFVTKGVRKGRLFGNYLNDASSLVTLTQAARLIWDDVSEEKKALWRDTFFYPQVRMLDLYAARNNIACWKRSAQGLVALLYDDEALWEKVMSGPDALWQQLNQCVTSDYIWFEQSLGYNYYVATALQPLFMEMARRGKMVEVENEAAIFENLILAPLMLRFPNGTLPGMADAAGRVKMASSLGRLSDVAHIFMAKPLLIYAERQKSWSGLLDPLPLVKSDELQLPPVTSHSMESTRVAVIKRSPWQIFFHYGQLAPNHAQNEALSFELFHEGTPVSVDAGTVAYGSPLYQEYYKAGLADNVPLVDGEPQSTWGRGELLQFDPSAALVSAGHFPFVPGWNVSRTLAIKDGHFVDLLRFIPSTQGDKGKESHAFGFLLHLEGENALEADAGYQPVTTFPTGRLKGFEQWSDVRRLEARDEVVLVLKAGTKRFSLRIRTEGLFKVYVGMTPGSPPARRTSLLIEKTAAQAEFETSLTNIGQP